VTDVDCIAKVERGDKLRKIIGVSVHVIAVSRF
jgi:hypothetical protein